MKRHLPLINSGLVLLFGIISVGLWIQKPEANVAYIRTAELIDQYKGTREALLKYEKKLAAWQANIDTLKFAFKKAVHNYEAEEVKPDAQTTTARRKALGNQQAALAQYQKAVAEKATRAEEKAFKGVLVQINAFVEKYAKEKGYSVILGTTKEGSLLYGDKAIDITEEVLEALNKEYSN